MSRFLAAAIACLLVGACHHSSGPSAAYAKSQELYLAAVTEKGTDAVFDPRVDEALSLARQVPADSLDSQAASAFVARVEADRKEAHEAAEKRRAAAELVPDPSAAPAQAPTPVATESAADAGTPPAYTPLVGSSAEEFQKRYGACVKVESPFVEKGGSRRGDVYALASAECEAQHPELKGQYVAVLDGKVFNVLVKSNAQKVEQPAPAAAPDAGTPAAPK